MSMRLPRRGHTTTRRALRTPLQGTSLEKTISKKLVSIERWIARFEGNTPQHLTVHQAARFIQSVERTRGFLMEHWKEILQVQKEAGGGPARDTLSVMTNIVQAYRDDPDQFMNAFLHGSDGSLLWVAKEALAELQVMLRSSSL